MKYFLNWNACLTALGVAIFESLFAEKDEKAWVEVTAL